MKLFDHLNNITVTKEPLNEDDLKGYSQYMINRFVSMSETFLPLVNEINKYDIPKDIHYKLLQSTLPKRKQYFKYLKGKKTDNQEEMKLIGKYFECGTRDVDGHLELLSEEQVKDIIDKYKTR